MGTLRSDGAPRLLFPAGRFIKYNVALCIMVAAALARGLQSGDKHTRAGTLLPSSLASPAPTGRHSARQPHRSAAFGLWAGRGDGSLSLARTCPHSADGPQTLRSGGRWLPSKCFPPSPAACYVLKRRTAGPLCLMAAGHQRGMAPLDSHRQCGAQREGSLFR